MKYKRRMWSHFIVLVAQVITVKLFEATNTISPHKAQVLVQLSVFQIIISWILFTSTVLYLKSKTKLFWLSNELSPFKTTSSRRHVSEFYTRVYWFVINCNVPHMKRILTFLGEMSSFPVVLWRFEVEPAFMMLVRVSLVEHRAGECMCVMFSVCPQRILLWAAFNGTPGFNIHFAACSEVSSTWVFKWSLLTLDHANRFPWRH